MSERSPISPSTCRIFVFAATWTVGGSLTGCGARDEGDSFDASGVTPETAATKGELCEVEELEDPWSKLEASDLSLEVPDFLLREGHCSPGYSHGPWEIYVMDIIANCHDWEECWGEYLEPPRDRGAASVARGITLPEPLSSEPFALTIGFSSTTSFRIEMWGTYALCGGPIERLAELEIEAPTAGNGASCFQLSSDEPYTHLVLVQHNVNGGHGDVTFCPGQGCSN